MSASFCALLTTRPTPSHLAAATQVDIAVAFLSASGVVLLFEQLRDVMKRGRRVRILTGDDLDVTEPDALRPPRGMVGQSARGYHTVSRKHARMARSEDTNVAWCCMAVATMMRSAESL